MALKRSDGGSLARRIYGVILPVLAFVSAISGQAVEVVPKEITVLPDQNVTVLCRVAYSIAYCRIEIPGEQALSLAPGQTQGGIKYFGSGLNHGECGATIDRVVDRNNGVIKCFIPNPSSPVELTGSTKLTVARAPSPPRLETSRSSTGPSSYAVNDVFSAQCVVAEGRPAATIKWYLGDEPLLEGLSQPVYQDVAGTDLLTTSQNLTRRLQAEDNGRVLRCVADHMALRPGTNVAQRQLEVDYAPMAREDPINVFGMKLGESGVINVTIRAHPRPGFTWKFSNQELQAGDVDNTGRIEVSSLIALGNDSYNATLRITPMSREDTDHAYVLTAYNKQGSTDYTIRISTLDEPQGVELDTGSIVGIVVAFLVLLIAVVLLVFAKVTHRWCFGDGKPKGEKKPKTKSSGESSGLAVESLLDPQEGASAFVISDTESAVGGPKAAATKKPTQVFGRNLPTMPKVTLPSMSLPSLPNLRAALPGRKGKDKVGQTQPDVEQGKPVEEEKPLQEPEGDKTLVYAELALSPSDARAKPAPAPEATEYAEIIIAPKEDKPKETDKPKE